MAPANQMIIPDLKITVEDYFKVIIKGARNSFYDLETPSIF
jgi:hypothetical protein